MVTVARDIEIDAAAGLGVDVAVATEIARAGARLGAVRFARIKETHVDVSPRHRADNKMRLRVTFVIDA
jgi:hypothetical protein